MTVSNKPIFIPEGCVAALGTFDGVHEGHRQVLAAAEQAGLPVVVVTSAQNPQSVLGRQVKHRIFSSDRCDALFESLGMSMWAKSEAEAAKDAFLLLGDPERAERITAAQAANIDPHGAANIVDLVMQL